MVLSRKAASCLSRGRKPTDGDSRAAATLSLLTRAVPPLRGSGGYFASLITVGLRPRLSHSATPWLRNGSPLPINIPLEQLPLLRRQGRHVGDQEAVVVEVEQHFAALAEVLHLALAPPHCE